MVAKVVLSAPNTGKQFDLSMSASYLGPRGRSATARFASQTAISEIRLPFRLQKSRCADSPTHACIRRPLAADVQNGEPSGCFSQSKCDQRNKIVTSSPTLTTGRTFPKFSAQVVD